MTIPTRMSNHIDEYGTSRVDTIEPFEPVPFCSAIFPSLTTVYVAAGTCVTVLVMVIGDPTVFVPDIEVAAAVERFASSKMDAVEMCMHPLGEHMSFFGQHPPPVCGEHATRESRHFGGYCSEAWH